MAMMTLMAVPTMATLSSGSSLLERTSFAGAPVKGLPALKTTTIKSPGGSLRIEARTRKVIPKEPLGPSGDMKFKVDASGRLPKGKGVYQFSKKYGANVDGYSPIYDKEEWTKSGDVYAGGQAGLALWAGLLGALLIAGALLVYNTSALAP